MFPMLEQFESAVNNVVASETAFCSGETWLDMRGETLCARVAFVLAVRT